MVEQPLFFGAFGSWRQVSALAMTMPSWDGTAELKSYSTLIAIIHYHFVLVTATAISSDNLHPHPTTTTTISFRVTQKHWRPYLIALSTTESIFGFNFIFFPFSTVYS
jgi:hypothetical protein